MAAAFIYLPAWAVWRRNSHLGTLGVAWPRASTWAVPVVALGLIFPLFAGGFFGYHTWLHDRTMCVSREGLADWPEQLTLGDEVTDGAVTANVRNRGLLVTNRTGPTDLTVTVSAAAQEGTVVTPRDRFDLTQDRTVRVPPGSWLLAQPAPGEAEVVLDSALEAEVTLPGQGHAELPYRAQRGYWWLVTLVFVQFILIALPEEIFFRGYLQTRLQALFPQRWLVWGGDVGPAVIVTSLVFAVSHLVAIPSGHRLAVFFPSLLFGWLRDRTGSVAASVVAHALSNILMQVLLRWLC